MQTSLGQTGQQISVIGLGTQQMSCDVWWGPADENESIRTIHAAIDSGITWIDTAPIYGFGHSEEVVGKALHGGKRDRVFLSTKCGLWWESKQQMFAFVMDRKKVYKCLKPEIIRQEIDQSLRRLKTDYIDLYHVHHYDGLTSICSIADTLNQLQKEGKIRFIGVSNITPNECEEYSKYCNITANQIKYSLLDKPIPNRELDIYRKLRISVIAYSVLEQGLLTGTILKTTALGKTDYRNYNQWFEEKKRSKVLKLLDSWKDLLAHYHCSIPQLVLAYTIGLPYIDMALCGARQAKHIQNAAAAMTVQLNEMDRWRMNKDLQSLSL